MNSAVISMHTLLASVPEQAYKMQLKIQRNSPTNMFRMVDGSESPTMIDLIMQSFKYLLKCVL
jgi:hypothetical protein